MITTLIILIVIVGVALFATGALALAHMMVAGATDWSVKGDLTEVIDGRDLLIRHGLLRPSALSWSKKRGGADLPVGVYPRQRGEDRPAAR